MSKLTLHPGDALEELKKLEDGSVDCIITSPPYWGLRDYGMAGQLGNEETFQEYISKLCDIFDECKRVLKDSGTCFVNIGDTYNRGQQSGDKRFGNEEFNKNRPSREATFLPGKKRQNYEDKTLLQIPSRFSIEMMDRGWILRNVIIWHKPNCMPASVTDRFTVDFEEIFFFTKKKKYYFQTQLEDATYTDSRNGKGLMKYENRLTSCNVKVSDKRNKRSVWKIPTKAFKEAHFATYPEALVEPMLGAGCPEGGIVLDPFFGAGTTGVVAKKQNKECIGIEINPEYLSIALNRITNTNVIEKLL